MSRWSTAPARSEAECQRSRALSTLVGAGGAFWVYSVFKTMKEHVGFDPGASGLPVLLTLIAISVATAPALVIAWMLRVRGATLRTTVLALIASGFPGTIGAEWLILADERAFVREAQVADAAGADRYGRSRAWPNANCSLVWNEGSGIHATD